MNNNYFISKCKDFWGNVRIFFSIISILYSVYADRLNVFLAKHNMVKVLTNYEIEYLGCPIASILVYDKLYKHYDIIAEKVDTYGELSNISDNIRMYNIQLKSIHSCISTFFKTTVR